MAPMARAFQAGLGEQGEQQRSPPMSPTLRQQLAEFDCLPDDAIFPDQPSAKILGISIWTLRRENPVPARQISERKRGRRVGDLRAKVRGTEHEQLKAKTPNAA
jgi:hypothetical protein